MLTGKKTLYNQHNQIIPRKIIGRKRQLVEGRRKG